MTQSLKEAVFEANMLIYRSGLAPLTWGNASGIDRELGVVAIKPSGVDYEKMTPDQMVLLDLDGNPVEAAGRKALRPSSDLASHLVIYRSSLEIGGMVHTHSSYATSFAQAMKPIPCLGTTHADAFPAVVPLTRALTPEEIGGEYEKETGNVMAETIIRDGKLTSQAVLVAGHGPFTFGKNALEAVQYSITLEEVAKMAFQTMLINPHIHPLQKPLMEKHYNRKHGPGAYYGQRP